MAQYKCYSHLEAYEPWRPVNYDGIPMRIFDAPSHQEQEWLQFEKNWWKFKHQQHDREPWRADEISRIRIDDDNFLLHFVFNFSRKMGPWWREIRQVLADEQPEESAVVKIMGKEVPVPRLQENYLFPYKFSGKNHGAKPLLRTPNLFIQLMTEVEMALETYLPAGSNLNFNEILVNWYRNGHDYIGAHSDDERQLVKGHPIASLGFGSGERLVRIRRKEAGEGANPIVCEHRVHNGSVYVMCGPTFQRDYTHEIVKVSGMVGESTGPRVSLTLRRFSP